MELDEEVPARRFGVKSVVALALALGAGVGAWFWFGREPPAPPPQAADVPQYRPVPVAVHRGPDVEDGFRGDVHPALFGQTQLDVEAHWSGIPVGTGRDRLDKTVPASVFRLFTEFEPVEPHATYTARDFSALMPESIESTGQVWQIEREDVARFLEQFHLRPSLHLVAFGRRAGPDGAFGVLRAVSPTHLDIMFRIHAEFDIAQNVWLTPACFWGQMIVDREAGTVVYFRIWVPTDNPLNVHLTVAESMPRGESKATVFREIQLGDFVSAKRDILRVEQMELAGGESGLPDALDWTESIDLELAKKKLKKAFYTFESIDWVPWDQALAAAAERKKPIMAVVLWGALDDQSC